VQRPICMDIEFDETTNGKEKLKVTEGLCLWLETEERQCDVCHLMPLKRRVEKSPPQADVSQDGEYIIST
jgi:hypothetical protein